MKYIFRGLSSSFKVSVFMNIVFLDHFLCFSFFIYPQRISYRKFKIFSTFCCVCVCVCSFNLILLFAEKCLLYRSFVTFFQSVIRFGNLTTLVYVDFSHFLKTLCGVACMSISVIFTSFLQIDIQGISKYRFMFRLFLIFDYCRTLTSQSMTFTGHSYMFIIVFFKVIPTRELLGYRIYSNR